MSTVCARSLLANATLAHAQPREAQERRTNSRVLALRSGLTALSAGIAARELGTPVEPEMLAAGGLLATSAGAATGAYLVKPPGPLHGVHVAAGLAVGGTVAIGAGLLTFMGTLNPVAAGAVTATTAGALACWVRAG